MKNWLTELFWRLTNKPIKPYIIVSVVISIIILIFAGFWWWLSIAALQVAVGLGINSYKEDGPIFLLVSFGMGLIIGAVLFGVGFLMSNFTGYYTVAEPVRSRLYFQSDAYDPSHFVYFDSSGTLNSISGSELRGKKNVYILVRYCADKNYFLIYDDVDYLENESSPVVMRKSEDIEAMRGYVESYVLVKKSSFMIIGHKIRFKTVSFPRERAKEICTCGEPI